ncbi:MAG: TMEM165/GDT1 family protein [Gloeomargarita sp. DG02_4_bins_56]
MNWSVFLAVFSTVFLAELGDKTQLATVLYASEATVNKWVVFSAASLALVLTSALGVLAGSLLNQWVPTKFLHYVAGAGFIVIGLLTLVKA